ncbi:MAG: invasion associated locus B family protein [Alphaproteobacteria bacterium]
MIGRLGIAALSVLLTATPGMAAEVKLIGKFAGWDAAAGGTGKSRTCYISSLPSKSKGKYKKRGEASLTIAHWPKRRRFNEVTIVAGYRYKKKSEAVVRIARANFRLFTKGQRAWAYAGDDARLVRAMKAGSVMVVIGISAKGTRTADTYSLKGISKALAAIGKACPRRRPKRGRRKRR